MGFDAHVGSFNIDTAKTAGQTQSVSGVGFTPKIVMFWWSGTTDTGNGVRGGNINMGFGAMSGASSRFAKGGISGDGQSSSVTQRTFSDVSCITSNDTPGLAFQGKADWGSLDADGFTITIDQQFIVAIHVNYLALGGDDLTNIAIGQMSGPGSTGNHSVTGLGFQPDAIILCNTMSTNDGYVADATFSIGYTAASSGVGVSAWGSVGSQATSYTYGYGYNGEIDAAIWADECYDRDSFVSFDSGGFTLNRLENGFGSGLGYIALKGGQYYVGDLTTRTDGNDISETVGFQPVAILFSSANRALSTQNTTTANGRLSIGAATSTSNRGAQAISDEDNLADTETATANYDTAVYLHVKDDVLEAAMDLKSIESDGFTCVMDDTETSGCWVTYLAFGAEGGDCTVETIVHMIVAQSDVITVVAMEG